MTFHNWHSYVFNLLIFYESESWYYCSSLSLEFELLREVQYTFKIHLTQNNAKWKLVFKCERSLKYYASSTETPTHTRNILLSQIMPIKAETIGFVKNELIFIQKDHILPLCILWHDIFSKLKTFLFIDCYHGSIMFNWNGRGDIMFHFLYYSR